MKGWLIKIFNWFFPDVTNCVLQNFKNHCPTCSKLNQDSRFCGKCLTNPKHVNQLFIGFVYDDCARNLMLRAKFHQDKSALIYLAKRLAGVNFDLPDIDLVIPMPINKKRLFSRGYNQIHFLIKFLIKKLGKKQKILCQKNILIKKNRPSQSQIEFNKRKINIKNAFICNQNLSGKNILLIDDVYTSGSTINEAAKTLKKAGAVNVYGLVFSAVIKE